MNKTNNVAILILTGIAALTIAVGIGRFSYTPILPYMISELNLTTTEAGLIASSNYLGYLLGSLIPIFPQFPKNIRSIFIYSIFISIVSLFSMGLTNTFEVFILIRFIHGIFSAFVLILGTSLIVSHVQKKGKIFLGTAHFSGVGLGMALSAIVVSYLGFLNFTWDELPLDTGNGVMTTLHGAEIAHWHNEIYEEHGWDHIDYLEFKIEGNHITIRNKSREGR